MKTNEGKTFMGKVVSTKMTKTVVVAIEQISRHPLYQKAIRKTRKFAAHNEIAGIAVGDIVKISETRPVSRRKHFKVVGKIT